MLFICNSLIVIYNLPVKNRSYHFFQRNINPTLEHISNTTGNTDQLENETLGVTLEKLEVRKIAIDQNFAERNCKSRLNLRFLTTRKINICLLPPNLDRIVSGTIRRGRMWEQDIQNWMFQKAFRKHPNAAFIDIGGYIGVYSLTAAALGRQVFTFEPMEKSLKYIK